MLAPEDREARRQAYVDAIWRIVEREGADRATMRAIAAEAGTSLGMLQHHFADKDEILAAAIRCRMASKHADLERSIAKLGDEPDAASLLRVALHHRLPLSPALRREAWVLQGWLASETRSPLKTQIRDEAGAELFAVLRSALGVAQAAGRTRAELDLDAITDSLIALNEGLLQRLVLGRCSARRATKIIEAQVHALVGDDPSQRRSANRSK